ncbi:MAG TPA: hypothetical protein VFR09_07925 [Alphaproteobacteria bacterium]|nr:hypothetical protein [Alphaproteobacteria bacterium]
MKLPVLTLALALLCLPAYASEEALIEPETALDKPSNVEHVEVKPSAEFPIDAENPPGQGDIACSYYQHVMVKQIDLGEKGAAQLSWIPIDAKGKKPTCAQQNASNEYVVPSDMWTGYYESAEWPYLFFGADDGSNGGMGFAVFNAADKKKVLEDTAVGSVESVSHDGTSAKLKYKRAWKASCSVMTEGDACWGKIQQALKLPAGGNIPNCADEYVKQKTDMAHMRCQSNGNDSQTCFENEMKNLDAQKWNESPSVIAYTVEVSLKGGESSVKPTGGDISCAPSE